MDEPVQTEGVNVSLPWQLRLMLTVSNPKFKLGAKMLLLWLGTLLGDSSSAPYPGNTLLAELCQVDKATVSRCQKQLIDLGLLKLSEGAEQAFSLALPECFSQEILLAHHTAMSVVNASKTLPLETRKAAVKSKRRPLSEPVPKPSPMSQEEMSLITSGIEPMTNYLLWGVAYFRVEDKSTLTPETMNWRMFAKFDDDGKITDPGIDQWSISQFMGYYWFRVAKYRAEHNVPITLPVYDRLAGELRNLLKQMTCMNAYRHISTMCQHFDLLRWMNPGIGLTLQLDEGSLSNPKIKQSVQSLLGMGDFQRGAMYQAIQAGLSFFDFQNNRQPQRVA
jgi:hypothetical protein